MIYYHKVTWDLLFLSDFKEMCIVPTDCRDILEYQFWWKSVQWEPSYSVRTDRQIWET